MSKEHYKHLLNSYGDRFSMKTKNNTGGSRVCRCLDEDNTPRDLPENGLSNVYDVKLSLPQLWIMGSDFGWTLECIHVLARPEGVERHYGIIR